MKIVLLNQVRIKIKDIKTFIINKKDKLIKKIDVRKKAFYIQIFFGYLNMLISILNGLILVPFYLKKVGASMYGYWITVNNLMIFLTILSLNVNSLYVQRTASATAKNNNEMIFSYFFTYVIFNFLVVLLYILFGLILYIEVANILNIYNPKIIFIVRQLVLVGIVIYSFNMMNNLLKGFFWGILKPLEIEIVFISGKMISMLLILYLLFRNYNIMSFPIGLLFGEFLIFLGGSFLVLNVIKKNNIKIRKEYIKLNLIKEILNIGPYLFLSMTGNKATELIYSFILTRFINAEITTSFTIYKKMADLIFHILNVINSSLLNFLSHLFAKENEKMAKDKIKKILLFIFIIIISLYLSYIFCNELFIDFWFKGKIIKIKRDIIFIFGIGMMIYTFNRFLRNILYAKNNFKLASLIIFFEGVFYTFLSLLFIRKYGIISIPISLLLTSILSFIILFFQLKKERVNGRF